MRCYGTTCVAITRCYDALPQLTIQEKIEQKKAEKLGLKSALSSSLSRISRGMSRDQIPEVDPLSGLGEGDDFVIHRRKSLVSVCSGKLDASSLSSYEPAENVRVSREVGK